MDVAPRAAPQRQRRAPVALARERPVDVVRQPVPEAPVLDVRRVPRRRSRWPPASARGPPSCGCTSSPSRSRSAASRSASSADRSARSRSRLNKQAARVEVRDQLLRQLGVLDEAALVGAPLAAAHPPVVGAVRPDRVVQRRRIGRGRRSRSPRAASKSSSPNAGAMCTRPVPSSVVTKSPATIGKPPVRRPARRSGPDSTRRRARRRDPPAGPPTAGVATAADQPPPPPTSARPGNRRGSRSLAQHPLDQRLRHDQSLVPVTRPART